MQRMILLMLTVGCGIGDDLGVNIDHAVELDHEVEMSRQLLDDAYGVSSNRRIVWSSETCPGTTRPACVWYGRCYAGVHVGDNTACVAVAPTVGETALTHELAHDVARKLWGDSDPGHQLGDFWDEISRLHHTAFDGMVIE